VQGIHEQLHTDKFRHYNKVELITEVDYIFSKVKFCHGSAVYRLPFDGQTPAMKLIAAAICALSEGKEGLLDTMATVVQCNRSKFYAKGINESM